MSQSALTRYKSIEDYVKFHNGKRVIKKILISNNGLSALKGIRSMKDWSYAAFGKVLLKFVVMATPEDLEANLEYIHCGDEMYQVPGGSNENNYANVKLIVDIARETNCDAVWPGWGHASEFPELPKQLAAAGIQFIGPDEKSMNMLGDKISSSIIAEHAGVPTIPWSGSGMKLGTDNVVTSEIYQKACVHSVEQALECAKKIGYPVMLKASEGGGGKGIRKCRSDEELFIMYDQVRKEVLGSPMFVMKLAENNRHLEVQLISDQYNNAVALFSRDCTVQRRHQKIIEEGPVTVAKESEIRKMEKAAVRLSKAVNYQNAGTVEYLYSPGRGFFFLELNPRLQVEHPVTEGITEVNIPSIQLQVAMGIPLCCIPDIRKFYGRKDLHGAGEIKFEEESPVPYKGHTIAVRITAENPENGFLGTSGTIDELIFQTSLNVYGYFSVRVPGGVHSFSDSQFGHIFARGKNREEARTNMLIALSRLVVRGKISNTSEYIMSLLEMDRFKNNTHTTAWLDSLIAEKEKLVKPDTFLVVICGALYRLTNLWNSNRKKYDLTVSRGQFPEDGLLATSFDLELVYEKTKYNVKCFVSEPNKFVLQLNNSFKETEVKVMSDDSLLVLVDGESHVIYGREESGGELRITLDGKVCYFTAESDPSKLKSSVSGKVVKLLCEDGDRVSAGQPFIELEVMKMILQMKTELGGVIKYDCVEGSVIDQGNLLASVDLDDKLQVKTADVFLGKFPDAKFVEKEEKKPHVVLQESLNCLKYFLLGYDYPPSLFAKKLSEAMDGLRHLQKGESVLIHQFVERLAIVRSAIPPSLKEKFEVLLLSGFGKDPELGRKLLEAYNSIKLPNPSRHEEFLMKTKPLLDILKETQTGMKYYAEHKFRPLLTFFLEIESQFDNRLPKDTVFDSLREQHRESMEKLHEIYLCHRRLKRNVKVVISLMKEYERMNLVKENEVLISRFESFLLRPYIEVVSMAKDILLRFRLPSFNIGRGRVETIMKNCITFEKNPEMRMKTMNSLVNNSNYGFDIILSFIDDKEKNLRDLSVEAYLRRAYVDFELEFLKINHECDGCWKTTFKFTDSKDNIFNQEVILGGISPSPSTDNLDGLEQNISHMSGGTTESPDGFGVLGLFTGLDVFLSEQPFHCLIEEFDSKQNSPDDRNVLSILIRENSEVGDQDELSDKFEKVIINNAKLLDRLDIRRITVVVLGGPRELFPNFFTFRKKLRYKEDQILRNIEPTLAYHLELKKLRYYKVTPVMISNSFVHAFYATPKKAGNEKFLKINTRFFIRTIVFQGDIFDDIDGLEFKIALAEKYFVRSLDALGHALSNRQFSETFSNHIFVNYIPVVTADENAVKFLVSKFQEKYAQRLINLRVSEVEMKINVRSSPDENTFIPIRVFIKNRTRYKLEINIYMETKNPVSNRTVYTPLFGMNKELDGKSVNTPYQLMDKVGIKRAMAHKYETPYVYDLPYIFERALKHEWNKYVSRGFYKKHKIPSILMEAEEIVIDPDDTSKLKVLPESPIGENSFGMVAWKIRIRTPHFPKKGREVIMFSNDINHVMGSFGPEEYKLYDLASKLSREMGIPRIYVSATAGARIGLASEFKKLFRICWVDPMQQEKGFKYLYLTPEDYAKFPDSVNVEVIEDEGEKRCRIVDIIGKYGINQENLSGSGLIAGESSRAYKEVFTMNYVAGTTVGIGAYVVRLGQRIIQNYKPPIILTGADALNKLLGKKVYVSHNQLGGTQIMYPNGVSHLCARDDIHAFKQIVEWLSFIAPTTSSPLPIMSPLDPIDRKVESLPTMFKDTYNPRDWICGKKVQGGMFLPGLFDKDSFFETLTGWATSIVVGRARLGGIPVGIISVETQTKFETIPADPADEKSMEVKIPKAGQVWFPDSAYKTAQAIWDFNNGEQLPLMIFANWRGFSGGQRDMFKEILKYGSYIVDALVDFKQPIFIYLPPHADLRGGAWVVLDPLINENCIEMYVDPRVRAGILEPSGLVAIKFKKNEIEAVLKRLDPKYLLLKRDHDEAEGEDEKLRLEKEMNERIDQIRVIYHSAATTFADLHDTPGRMKKVGVVREIVPFGNARVYFYHRLRRRLKEFDIFEKWEKVEGTVKFGHKRKEKEAALKALVNDEKIWNHDEGCYHWYERNEKMIEAHLEEAKKFSFDKKIEELLLNNPEMILSKVLEFTKRPENKEFKRTMLNNLIISSPFMERK